MVETVFQPPLASRTLATSSSFAATHPRPFVFLPCVCQRAESLLLPAISFWKPLSTQGMSSSAARK